MRNWKRWMVRGYVGATWPYRRWVHCARHRSQRMPVYVLFYHRVEDHDLNPWTISRSDFVQHLDWLEGRFDFVSLEEAQRRIRGSHNRRPAISITFDDGYADNCLFALPELVRRQIPVTYFVTSDHVLHQQPFPHDVDLGRPLTPNSIESLRALVASGVEIGAHTRTHVDLGTLTDESRIYDELVIATRDLEQVLETRIRYFAFPYGTYANLNASVFQMARRNGFEGVCSAYGGFNEIGDDDFHLQRIHGDPSLTRLRNWLTFDPRQYHRKPAEFMVPVEEVTTPKAADIEGLPEQHEEFFTEKVVAR